MKPVLLCAAALLFAGCSATSGTKIDEQQAAELRVGSTTVADVLARYGPPSARIQSSDGSQTLTYAHFAWQVNAATYVPIVGLFAGGGSTKGRSVTLRFDPRGRLLDVISSDTTATTGAPIQ